MADESESTGDKTEAATSRHLDQARDAGRVPISREATVFASMTAVVGVLAYQAQATMRDLLAVLSRFLTHADDSWVAGSGNAVRAVFAAILPYLAAATVGATAAVLVQTGFLLSGSALQPKFSRISPAAGLKRLFGRQGLEELVKSLAKLAAYSAAIWIAVRGDLPGLMLLPRQDPGGLPSTVAGPIFHIFLASLLCHAIVATADIFWVRFRYARDLRMSRQDIRDEFKETEGNPHTKARIRRIRMMRARKRMMAQVPKATVVVTNPTHYAVALAYDRATNPAPRVVAKGTDEVAARIREVAEAANVPVVANPPLARALYRLELDAEIPAEHYKAVAEIIAYVWRLGRRSLPVG
nr:EscU/YscU/HrcU family type III secretion system export apparatus switch protein [uncultured Rhodopila sp.]